MLAELAARLWGRRPPPARPPVAASVRDLEDLRGPLSLGRPDLRAQNAGALFVTNSAGFRGRERSRDKPAGGVRIALIGDSFAMGWGVEEEETYAFRLERSLDARTDAPVEVLNFGLAGLDAVAAVERLHTLALGFDPDLLVYGFTLNDIENEHYRASRADIAEVQRFLVTQPSELFRVLAPRIGGLLEAIHPYEGTYVYELDDNYFRNPPAWRALADALDRFAEAAGDCGIVLIHTRLHLLNVLHPYHRHYEAVAEAARERGLVAVPTVEAFLGRKDRDLWVAPDDPHPGPEAHALLAEVLEGAVVDRAPACTAGVVFAPRGV